MFDLEIKLRGVHAPAAPGRMVGRGASRWFECASCITIKKTQAWVFPVAVSWFLMLLFCRVSPNTFSRHPNKLCFTGRLLPYSRSIISWTSLPKSKTLWRDYHQCENNLTFNCSRVPILISPTQSYTSCLLRMPIGDEQNWDLDFFCFWLPYIFSSNDGACQCSDF